MAINGNFDERGYLQANPDVAAAVRSGNFSSGLEHFQKYGQAEGRISATRDPDKFFAKFKEKLYHAFHNSRSMVSKIPERIQSASREEKILSSIDKKLSGLEIGPSHRPVAPKRDGYKVKILDHLDAVGLRKKYHSHGVEIAAIEDVDYVWSGEPLSKLVGDQCFDWIIASHVIEHTPDLVGFLSECERILSDTGVLSLAVPDKRYCFDHFREVTSLARVIDAHFLKTTNHTPGTAADYYLNVTKKGGIIAWAPGQRGEYEFVHGLQDALSSMQKINSGDYIDLHAWCFTPASFRLLIEDLFALGLTGLREQKFFDTLGGEFFITLGKDAAGPNISRMEMLHQKQTELTHQS